MYWKRACVFLLLCAATAIVSPAQTFTSLVSFDIANGTYPNGPLLQSVNGDLYGTTPYGGGSASCPYGCGTIFKITAKGALITVHAFELTDGAGPSVLVQSFNGYFYGFTTNGGQNNCAFPCGDGTFFKISPAGALTTIYRFNGTEGAKGANSLMQAANGDFYGTTGSINYNGTIFKITPAGVLTTLYRFTGQSDGASPYGGLIQATDGNLYGTTYYGGVIQRYCAAGCGTIFKISPAGVFTTLHSFNYTEGYLANGVIQAADGDLYGTATNGGSDFGEVGYGTIFKITLAGNLTTLHTFEGTDGDEPTAGLLQATDGNFYGTTLGLSDTTSQGTIFEITPAGVLSTLHSFSGPDGDWPAGGLMQATNGSIYGTTQDGGTSTACTTTFGATGCGTAFSLSVGLGPFVKTLPDVGGVGAIVRILGTDLTGATSVTFNGTPAELAVVRPSEIITKVPAGATTGKVQVITPGVALVSNEGFYVP